MAAWNRELAWHAAPLCRARHAYAAALGPAARAIYEELGGDAGRLEIAYRPSLASCRQDAENAELARDILGEFDYIGENEFRRGRLLIGPHRDDFEIRLDGRDLRAFGSQGETRTAAIAMILAQSEVVFQQRGSRPVLFLDDIFSELDPQRTGRLQERCARDHQVFVATARPEDVSRWRPDALRSWRVEAGAADRDHMNDGKRHGSPLPLDRVLAGVLRSCGLEDRLAQRRALEAWDAIVGREIAAHARAIDLENGVLTLQADHGAWRQELMLLLPQIMVRFNDRFGPGTVTAIQWARGATDRWRRDNRD